ncbi:DUF4174 domain-containing protein [Longibacter sp.]|uniref:DUF4174 domain-containing protein n=1 Tax=Longibacter sp. TaxID=2045415 RepID=UPI003EBE24C2
MATPSDSVHANLSQHEWEHRLLVVFAPAADHENLARQFEMWEGHADGFAERKLRIYTVTEGDAGQFRKQPGGDVRPLTRGSAQELRDRFDVATDPFAVILVGLDGTEKRRETVPLSIDDLFRTIDAMPMRRAEMQQDGGG